MTDSANPGGGIRDADPYLTSGAIRYGGGDWIVPGDQVVLADHEGLSGTPLNAFDESHSASSFDVEIDTGELFVEGSWAARDATTTVTLVSQTSNQTVYVGWEKGTSNAVVVGLDAAFDPAWPRIAIWEFDTDGSGVTAARDLRPLGETIPTELAMGVPGGIKKLIFPNDPGEDDMALVFRSGEEAVTVENDSTGEKIVSVGLNGLLSEGGSPVITEDEESGLSVENADELGNDVSTAHLRAALAAHGYDVTNIGMFSATNGTVGGSPVITADGSQDFAGAVNFGSNNAIDLADPAGPQHAATRSYVSDNYVEDSELSANYYDETESDNRFINDESGSVSQSNINSASQLQSKPNGHIRRLKVQGGKYASVGHPIPGNKSFYLYYYAQALWGEFEQDELNGTGASGIRTRVKDDSGTLVYDENTTPNSGDPIATFNSTDAIEVQVYNNTPNEKYIGLNYGYEIG